MYQAARHSFPRGVPKESALTKTLPEGGLSSWTVARPICPGSVEKLQINGDVTFPQGAHSTLEMDIDFVGSGGRI